MGEGLEVNTTEKGSMSHARSMLFLARGSFPGDIVRRDQVRGVFEREEARGRQRRYKEKQD